MADSRRDCFGVYIVTRDTITVGVFDDDELQYVAVLRVVRGAGAIAARSLGGWCKCNFISRFGNTPAV